MLLPSSRIRRYFHDDLLLQAEIWHDTSQKEYCKAYDSILNFCSYHDLASYFYISPTMIDLMPPAILKGWLSGSLLKYEPKTSAFWKSRIFLLENSYGSPSSHPKIETEPSCYLNRMTILLPKSIKSDLLHRAYPRQVLVLLTLKTSINDLRRLVSRSPWSRLRWDR